MSLYFNNQNSALICEKFLKQNILFTHFDSRFSGFLINWRWNLKYTSNIFVFQIPNYFSRKTKRIMYDQLVHCQKSRVDFLSAVLLSGPKSRNASPTSSATAEIAAEDSVSYQQLSWQHSLWYFVWGMSVRITKVI